MCTRDSQAEFTGYCTFARRIAPKNQWSLSRSDLSWDQPTLCRGCDRGKRLLGEGNHPVKEEAPESIMTPHFPNKDFSLESWFFWLVLQPLWGHCLSILDSATAQDSLGRSPGGRRSEWLKDLVVLIFLSWFFALGHKREVFVDNPWHKIDTEFRF